jgi:hypothetical protein
VDWVARLTGIVGASVGEHAAVAASEPGYFAPFFGDAAGDDVATGDRRREVDIRVFRHEKTLDGPGLVRLVQSRSNYLTASPERQHAVIAAVEHLVATHPDLAGRQTFVMPYATYAFRVRVRESVH